MDIVKGLKKSLMGLKKNQIRLSHHAMAQLAKRGYQKGDLVSGILTSKLLEIQWKKNREKYVLMGRDLDHNPIVLVVGMANDEFIIITAMPPINPSRFTECV